MTPALVDLFRRHQVWDYSQANAARYPELGLAPPRVVPIGWVPELSRIEPAAEEIDVLFYGSMNERRRAILEALTARGLRVHVAFGVYGEARDRLVARSRIVLNIHFYEAKVFEIVRVSYLLANRCCVVSERGAEPSEEREFEGAVAFADSQELVGTCVRLCADPDARRQLREQGLRAMAARDLRIILAEALGLAPPPPRPSPSRPTMTTSSPAASAVPAYYHCDRPEVVARVQPAGRRVLDVGCAAGAMGAAMLAAGAAEVVGIEVHPPAAALARGRLTAVYRYDLETLPELPYPEGYFDVITLADVLEHLREPAAALRHLRRWLADDGRIVCSLPNIRHESVLLPLLVHGRWDYVDAGILDRTHLRFFTLSSMIRLLAEAGFELDGQVEGVRSPPSPQLELAAELVVALGGDKERFRQEAQVIQVVLAARPAQRSGARSEPILDPWRGSRPVRVLVAPDLSNPADPWAATLATVVDGLGPCDTVTVAVALPLAHLSPRRRRSCRWPSGPGSTSSSPRPPRTWPAGSGCSAGPRSGWSPRTGRRCCRWRPRSGWTSRTSVPTPRPHDPVRAPSTPGLLDQGLPSPGCRSGSSCWNSTTSSMRRFISCASGVPSRLMGRVLAKPTAERWEGGIWWAASR